MGLAPLDGVLLAAVNGLVGRWPALDHLVAVLAANHLVKGGALMALVWWGWFCPAGRGEVVRRRKAIVATLAGTVVALAIARGLEVLLPFRSRPIYDPALALHPPIGLPPDAMSEMSSFPSDHAVLFYALVAGLFVVSRPLGVLAAAWVTGVILLPRLYLGWHYPSDFVAGAAIGVGCVAAAQWSAIRDRLAPPVLAWGRGHPQAFHAAFFLVSYQLATLMEDTRVLAGLGLWLLGRHPL